MITVAMTNEIAMSVESMQTNTNPRPAEGFSVLVVDGDSGCLALLSRMLWCLGYKVLTAGGASEALSMAQQEEAHIHLVLTEARLPGVGKYELLERITEETKLPVVVMSNIDDKNSKIEFLVKGAAYYLVKPLSKESLKNLWQFAFRNTRNVVIEESNDHAVLPGMIPDFNIRLSDGMDTNDEKDSSSEISYTKRRIIWTHELHQRFLQAVKLLGVNGRPRQIVQIMNVPGLTKRNISSHLQKYRHSWRQEQLAIQKRRIRASKTACSKPRKSSSTFDFQEQFPQIPNLYSTSTPYQPQEELSQVPNLYSTSTSTSTSTSPTCEQIRSHSVEHLSGQMPTRPGFGSANFPIHVDSSTYETSDEKYAQPTQSCQLDFTYLNAKNVGPIESFLIDDIFQDQNKNFTNVGDFGHQYVTDFPPLKQEEHHEEQQKPSPQPSVLPPPPPLEQEEDNTFADFDPDILQLMLLTPQEQEACNIFGEFDPHIQLSPLPTSHDTFAFRAGESDDSFISSEEGTVQMFDDVDSDDFF